MLVELELEQFDDPFLGPDVGRLHGLEEVGLRGGVAIRVGDGHHRLKDLRLGHAQLDPRDQPRLSGLVPA